MYFMVAAIIFNHDNKLLISEVCGYPAALRHLQDQMNYEEIKFPGGYVPGDTIEASCFSGGRQ